MVTFFKRKLFKRNSCKTAKDRLKILLISDRVDCSPEMIETIKCEISDVISKYMIIDKESVEIRISSKNKKSVMQSNRLPVLYANIPILELHK